VEESTGDPRISFNNRLTQCFSANKIGHHHIRGTLEIDQ